MRLAWVLFVLTILPTSWTKRPKDHRLHHIGCFKDSDPRDLPQRVHAPELNARICVHKCKELEFKYAGLQFSYLCFCGNTYGRYGELSQDKCSSECKSKRDSFCGGHWSNSVYDTGYKPASATHKQVKRDEVVLFDNVKEYNHRPEDRTLTIDVNPAEYSYIPRPLKESNTRTQRSALYDPSSYKDSEYGSNPANNGISSTAYGTETGQEQIATAYDQAFNDQGNTDSNNYFYDSTQLTSSNDSSENTTAYNLDSQQQQQQQQIDMGNVFPASENKTDNSPTSSYNSAWPGTSYNSSEVSSMSLNNTEGPVALYRSTEVSSNTYNNTETDLSESQYDQQSANFTSQDALSATEAPSDNRSNNGYSSYGKVAENSSTYTWEQNAPNQTNSFNGTSEFGVSQANTSAGYTSYGQVADNSSTYNWEQNAQNQTNSFNGTADFSVSQTKTTGNITDYLSNSTELYNQQAADYISSVQTQASTQGPSSAPAPYPAYAPYPYPSPYPAPYPSPYPAPSYAPYPAPYPGYAPYSYPSPASYSSYPAPSSASVPSPVPTKETNNNSK
ncbi:probable ATP-dependent RNA helicase ddx17 [Montipora foliosa]|uniref:probable ATP-dependent RNA helicase ddx17 n=1 Tax=Montipora foliosa TaxID=591990 RepID=UPI0035F1B0F9